MALIQNVYLAGLGAIGSAYASRFYDLDPGSVKIIVDKERLERYGRQGITVNGKSYGFHFIHPDVDAPPADLILIAVKYHHLETIIQEIRPFVGEKTVILSLLNGITSEELFGKVYGMDKMLYSFVVGTDAVRVGTGTRFSSPGRIVFGEKLNATYSPKVTAVKELFDRHAIPYQIPENMWRELWWKFMMNVGVNQTSAVLKAPYGVFQTVSEARELMTLASREVLQLSKAFGLDLTEQDIRDQIAIIDGLSPEGKTSMLQDVEAGRQTEVAIFAGTVVDLGRRHGVATPVNEVLLRMIRTLEQTYPKR